MLQNIGFYLTFRPISRIMRTIKTVKMRLEFRQDLYLGVTAERLHLRLS